MTKIINHSKARHDISIAALGKIKIYLKKASFISFIQTLDYSKGVCLWADLINVLFKNIANGDNYLLVSATNINSQFA